MRAVKIFLNFLQVLFDEYTRARARRREREIHTRADLAITEKFR